MDTSNDENADTFGDENKDIISELPDMLVVRILSSLPIKDAINSLLIRRFGNLWRSITVLDIDHGQFHNCRGDNHSQLLANLIRHVLLLHDGGTLDKLRLHYVCSHGKVDEEQFNIQDAKEQIKKLIQYAINKNVEILDLNFQPCCMFNSTAYQLLPNVFTSHYLTELRLLSCSMKSLTEIDLKFLKILYLEEVALNDDTMENLLVACPLIEDLSIVSCYRLCNLNCKNPNLKKVRVKLLTPDMIVSCPNVVSLEIDGFIERTILLDASSVVNFSINYGIYFAFGQDTGWRKVKSLLEKVCQSKTLNLCDRIILILSVWNFKKIACPDFSFCENLSVGFGPNKWMLGVSQMYFGLMILIWILIGTL